MRVRESDVVIDGVRLQILQGMLTKAVVVFRPGNGIRRKKVLGNRQKRHWK